VIVGGSIAVYQERKLKETRLQLLETEKALLSAKAGEMEAKAKEKTDELNFQLLKTSSRVELLKEFKDKLDSESKMPNRSTETKSLLRGLIRELNRELQSENYWDHFERNYKDLHDAFSDTLIAVHPGLTKGEIRLSYLIRQKMNNKEIATVLNVSPAAVEKAKYRLKKKITLEKEESLDTYIQQL
jgi:DNA-binding CsgD family transcriptional regulator